MYYVGIDIAKHKHDCFISSSEGVTVCESLTFDNTYQAYFWQI